MEPARRDASLTRLGTDRRGGRPPGRADSGGDDRNLRVAALGVRVPFEVESFDADEGRGRYRWTWRVAGVPAIGHRLEPICENRCRVGFEIPLVGAGYCVVCASALRRIERLVV
ncbi:polyketide cyclase [Haloprofundus salilacus]|uniref:polyketide cyclase n=1 Tax=Haloprofundus salilacus TaxID=2876190 RepID=UPI00295F44ED|nr:polyketide cyclase [Haloprofundus salilacus]